MTNLQTPLLHPWMIGTAIFATGMLILNVGTASAEIKTKELPYMSAADLERRCDAEKGKFSVTLTAYSCEGKGGTVVCDSDTKKCSGTTKSSRLPGHLRMPTSVQTLPELSPAEN